MAGRPKLAGAARDCARVLHFTNRLPREREEGEGSSFPSFAGPGKDPRGADRSGAIADAFGAREQGPRRHETEREKHREKVGEKAMLTTARSGAKTARNVDRRAADGGGFPCLRESSRKGKGEMKWGRREAARARAWFKKP